MTSPSGGGSSLLETLLIELRLNGLGQLTQLQGSLGRATDSSKALSLALAGIGTGLLALAGKAVQAAGDMEQAEASFTTLLKSATKAKAFLGELQQFAANTPFEFKDLQKSAQQMLAYGFSAKQVIPMLTAVGDAAGGQADKIESITRALGQIQAKGKVSAEEMQQLAEAGIPAWDMLAKAIGTTVPEAMKRSQAGTISAMQAIPGMLVQMETKFSGGMERQSKTLLGIWSNFQDSLNMTMIEIGDSLIKAFDLKGVLNTVVAGLNQVKSALKGFDLKVWATDNADAIAMVGGAITAALIPAAIAGAVALAEFIIPLAPLLIAGAAIGLAMKRMGVSFDDIRQAVGRGVQTFEQLRSGVGSALSAMQDKAAPILANFRSAAIDAFMTIKATWERVGAPIWRDIQPIIQNALQGVMPLLTGFSELVKGAFSFIRRYVEQVLIPAFEWIWPHIKPILEYVGGYIRTTFEWIGSLFAAVGQALQGHWSEAWEGIKTGTIKALTGLAQLLSTLMEPMFVNAAAFGTRIKDGILSGLSGLGAAITESISKAILNATSALPQDLKNFLGISGAIDKLNGQAAALRTGQTNAQNDSAATATIQGLSGNKQAQAFFQAIFGQESKNNKQDANGYGVINPESGALGKYQVMGQNLLGGRYDSSRNTWGWMATHMDDMGVKGQGWDAKALGRDVSLREYINSPKIQEAIAQSQMGQNLQKWMAKFPNDMQRAVKEAALDWYGRGTPAPGNPSGAEYADSIWQKFKAAAGVQDTPVGTPMNAVARFPAPPAAAAGKPPVDAVQAIKDVFPMGPGITAPDAKTLKQYNLTLADWNKLQGRAMELAREAAKAESDLTGKRGLQVAAAVRAWEGSSAARKASYGLAGDLVNKQAQLEQQRLNDDAQARAEHDRRVQAATASQKAADQALADGKSKLAADASKNVLAAYDLEVAKAGSSASAKLLVEQAWKDKRLAAMNSLSRAEAQGQITDLVQERNRLVNAEGVTKDQRQALWAQYADRIAKINQGLTGTLAANQQTITASVKAAQAEQVRVVQANAAKVAASLADVLANPDQYRDGARGLTTPLQIGLKELMTQLPKTDAEAQKYISTLLELEKQGLVSAASVAAVKAQVASMGVEARVAAGEFDHIADGGREGFTALKVSIEDALQNIPEGTDAAAAYLKVLQDMDSSGQLAAGAIDAVTKAIDLQAQRIQAMISMTLADPSLARGQTDPNDPVALANRGLGNQMPGLTGGASALPTRPTPKTNPDGTPYTDPGVDARTGDTTARDAAYGDFQATEAQDRYIQSLTRMDAAQLQAEEATMRRLKSVTLLKLVLAEMSQRERDAAQATKDAAEKAAQAQQDATAKAVKATEDFMAAQLQVGDAERALARVQGEVIPQYQSEIDALEKLKAQYPELAGRIDLVVAAYKRLQSINTPLEKFQEYAGYVRELSAALGGLADAAGASDLAANLNGLGNLAGKLMDLGTDVARILANPADIGAWVGAITKVVGGIAEAIGGFQKAKQQAKELGASFQEQFTFANGEDFAKTFVRSRGFLADLFGGGPEVVQEIDKLGTVFAKSMDAAFASGIKDGMKNALMANDFSKFGATLKETIFGSVVDGLAEAFKSQLLMTIIGPAIKAWADALKTPGTEDDQAAIQGIKEAVGQADQLGQAYYSQVSPLLEGLKSDFGLDDSGKATGSGSSSIIGAGPSAIYGVPEIRLPAIALTAFTNLAALDVPMFNTASQRLLSAANLIMSALGPQATSRSGTGGLG